MSVTSHLKDLLTKMGGTPKAGDSTSVLIDKIEDVYNGSGSGGGSISDLPFVVTIYADDAVDDPESSASYANVTLKLNKKYNEIASAYNAGRHIIFKFEMRSWSLSNPPYSSEVLPLVLHNNHSTAISGETTVAEYVGTKKIMIVNEAYYNAHRSVAIDDLAGFIWMSDWIVDSAIIMGTSDDYKVFVTMKAVLDGTFGCANADDYPSTVITVSTIDDRE